ncbi:uncharacterized protein B0I36DRAFT_329307 [Microdochium trichocladiopsis]|uniref:Uncharacterized protein n=1 Tax=Microdochium trichocladiopsis TaxID=1682393 RepID=A0A9P8XZR9_9PEZI|nr:uncharacterized protein B0I36DRAFT_329307 [Microdochium trichocladiopsis]KAH7025866.1 hypothetical protein B0I36DRAFT_329307 [Microdochium trichocladiopsis]
MYAHAQNNLGLGPSCFAAGTLVRGHYHAFMSVRGDGACSQDHRPARTLLVLRAILNPTFVVRDFSKGSLLKIHHKRDPIPLHTAPDTRAREQRRGSLALGIIDTDHDMTRATLRPARYAPPRRPAQAWAFLCFDRVKPQFGKYPTETGGLRGVSLAQSSFVVPLGSLAVYP